MKRVIFIVLLVIPIISLKSQERIDKKKIYITRIELISQYPSTLRMFQHLKKVENIISQIQNEFNSLNINSKYLTSKLYFTISVVQNLDFFHLTYMFYSMGLMVGEKKWTLDTLASDYASAIDHLIKISTVFKNELNPYWDLVKEKSTIDILE